MLRCVPDAARLAGQLGEAWQRATGLAVEPAPAAASIAPASPAVAVPSQVAVASQGAGRTEGNGRMAAA